MKKEKLKDALKRHLQNEKLSKHQSSLQAGLKNKQLQHKNMVNSRLRNVFKWSDGVVGGTPFRTDMNVVVVGDGDFSFAVSLSKSLSNNANIIATVYDGRQEFEEKYGRQNVAVLESAANVQSVLFKVDAQHLKRALGEADCRNVDAIVFNFPHTGSGVKDRSRNIRGNQLLLSNFFQSCRQVFGDGRVDNSRSLSVSCSRTSNHNQGHVVERDSNDGKPVQMVIVTLWCGDPYDDWKVKSLAKAHGFGNVQAVPFRFEDYPGYRHQRTDGLAFTPMDAVKESRMYLFTLSDDDGNTRNNKSNKKKKEKVLSDDE